MANLYATIKESAAQVNKQPIEAVSGVQELHSALVGLIQDAMDDTATTDAQRGVLARIRAYLDINLKSI